MTWMGTYGLLCDMAILHRFNQNIFHVQVTSGLWCSKSRALSQIKDTSRRHSLGGGGGGVDILRGRWRDNVAC